MSEELKKLQDATEKTINESMVKVESKIQKETDEKIAAQTKTIDELKSKVTSMEKANKGFIIGSNNFPNKIKLGGSEYRVDDLGANLTKRALQSKVSKGEFKFMGIDGEQFYNFKCYMAALLKCRADFKNQHPDLRNKLAEYHAKATAMAEGSAGYGLEYIPVEYQNELILLVREDSMALQECNTSIKMSSNSLILPAELTGFTAYWIAEASSITESNFTSSNVTLTAKKLCALTETISSELIQDSMFDLVSYVTEAIAYAKAQALDYEVLFGASGTWGANIGLLTAIITQSRTVTGNPNTSIAGLTDEDISYAIQSLSAKDSANGKLIIGKLVQHYIRTLKDNNGSPIFVPPSGPSVPGTVYGYPYQVWAQAAVSDAANTTFGVFGDLKQFYVAQRIGEMGIEADPYHEFATDQIRFRSVSRWALKPRRVSAFVRLVTHA